MASTSYLVLPNIASLVLVLMLLIMCERTSWHCIQALSTDVGALLAFKAAVVPQGSGADPLPNWVGTDSSPCGWMGVTCNSNNEELVLGSNSLSGLIPPQIGTLSSLQYLDLSSNTFSGTVPLQLGNLVNLQHLDLSSNALSGTLPPELGNLVNLQSFYLGSSHLTGSIPEEISLLRSLRKLDLGGNSFVGSIPDSIGNLRNLQTLNLPSNQLTGSIPPELAQLTNLTTLDLSCNMLNGSIPAEIGEVGKLQGLNLAYNSLTGQIPPQLGDIASLTKLNLSGNMLSGSIPNTLGNLTGLSRLDVSNNQLSGGLPSSLATLEYLTFLNMSYNDLEGQIPSTGMCAKLGASSFIADPGLCGGILGTECTSNYMTMTPTNLLSTGAILGITIGCTIAFLGLLFVVLSTCLTMAKSKEPLSINVAMFEQPLLRLTLADILLATNNFCKTNIIGDGGFGTVYKAILPDGKTVAIKKLGAARTQGNREFLAEMETLGKVKHRNLVPLLGYCSFGEEKLLVYEYMVNGSLDLWLRNRADAVEVLDWNKRFKIAMGSARGLNFLHHGFIPHIIHRDVKTSNILLDADFEPRVADFGLARLISAYETHVSTDIAGTFGYIPPEYGQSWRSTTRGDVYSYGVILLELLTGKEPTGVEFKEMEGGNLVGWVRQMIKQGAAQDVLDPTVSNGSCKMSMLKVLHIANLCTAEDPLMRPTMLQVVKSLVSLKSQSTLYICFSGMVP
ncbi:unnamed protein product [Sphagnum jensenii]|uniref:Protein kinase domain-containing protein n=1 Tax=Sphagnum jensenii TaxID=128206 RepID=A0ABP0WXH2_9BRYO